MTTTAPRRPAFIPSLIYRDNRAALNWLQSAFGFEASEVLTDANGNIVHAEMTHGDGVIMIGNEFAEWTKSPVSIGGKNTQRIHVRLERGMDEHCERARQAGAKIAMEPADQFYGDRNAGVRDAHGNEWWMATHKEDVPPEEMKRRAQAQAKSGS